MFTREDISSLQVPDAKFQKAKSEYFGKIIVTIEIKGVVPFKWKEANVIPLVTKGLRNK